MLSPLKDSQDHLSMLWQAFSQEGSSRSAYDKAYLHVGQQMQKELQQSTNTKVKQFKGTVSFVEASGESKSDVAYYHTTFESLLMAPK